MANATMFKARMASESVLSLVGSTKFQDSSEYAPITDGALVVLQGLAPNDAYNIGDVDDAVDYNVFLSAAPTAPTDDVVIVDIAGISNGDIAGNNYKMGIKLYGLTAPAGEAVRYRTLMKGDMYWLSDGCFVSAPTVGQYAIATASSVQHTPNASNPGAGQYCVKILASKGFTAGSNNIGTLYLCQVQ